MSSRGKTIGRWRAPTAYSGYRSRGSRSGGRGGYPSPATQPVQPRWQQRREPPPRPPSPPLGPVLTTLSEKDLNSANDLDEGRTRITDCEYVASYNWLNRGKPTIVVPGNPPAWSPLRSPEKLKEDSGKYFRDTNAAHYPKYPTEPAVHAVFAEQADFPTSTIDVFACGSTIGNLLRFVLKIDRSFRFLVEVVGDTVFFVRRENSPTELIPDVWGYGHAFSDAYTTWDASVRGSESHQRIIQYTFGGLIFLVRFEADGYHKDLVPNEQQLPHMAGESGKARQHSDADISEALSLTFLDQQTPVTTSETGLTIKFGGQRIPQSTIFDLKTRSIKKLDHDVLSEELPRLWVAQIPNFVLAYHTYGVFTDIRTRCVRGEIEAWETEKEDTLRQLSVLIRKIIEFAKSKSDGKLEVRRTGTEILELREQAGKGSSVLPPEVKVRWLGRRNDEKEGKGKGKEAQLPSSSPPDDDDDDHFYDSNESAKDFTACSADGCGYCGHCTY